MTTNNGSGRDDAGSGANNFSLNRHFLLLSLLPFFGEAEMKSAKEEASRDEATKQDGSRAKSSLKQVLGGSNPALCMQQLSSQRG
ncbi:hypothetical protein PIB30_000073, partial [Stylosanthes scabra]|nr:hypothetical protein [Stylosanthes scabra]